MKETGLTGKGRSTTIAATPDDGKARGKEEEEEDFRVFSRFRDGDCFGNSPDFGEVLFRDNPG